MKTEYTIVTNIYNESGRILPVLKMIADQTVRPKYWLWIDDGSNDNGLGRREIMKYSARLDLPASIVELPPKDKGTLATIGLAWNEALPHLKSELKSDYLTVVDVDNRYPEDYYEDMLRYLKDNPAVGAVAGQARGEGKRKKDWPMGGGKIVRWEIIDSIDKFWKYAPDSFLNIKSRALGFESVSRDLLIDSTTQTIGWTGQGMREYGRRRHYVGTSILLIGYISIRNMFKRSHGLQILRGYLKARFWNRMKQCDDKDVRYEYSNRHGLKKLYRRIRN